MTDDKVDVPIKISLEGSDIKKLVEDNLNSAIKEGETLKRDKLLLKLIIHYYEEDERRNKLIDSKNSQMIVLSGAMLTLQATLITKLFVDTILLNEKIALNCYWELFLAIIMIISFLGYLYAMYKFIDAYAFQDEYQMVPDPNSVMESKLDNESEETIIKDMLKEVNEACNLNDNIMIKKVDKSKEGFNILKISGIITLFFILTILFLIFSVQ